MDLNGQLKQYLEVKNVERARKHQEDMDKWLYSLSEQMKKKVKWMIDDGLNFIILEYKKEMVPFYYILNSSRIAKKAGIDWKLINDYKWVSNARELHITFNLPTKV